MRKAKAEKRQAACDRMPVRKGPPERPELCRIVVVIDFTGGRPWMRMMQFWKGGRADQYMVRTVKGWSKRPVGFSHALSVLRKKFPPVRSSYA